MTYLIHIALVCACVLITAVQTSGQRIPGSLPAQGPSLKGTLSDLPPSRPQKCYDVTERRRVDDEAHVRSKAWDILNEWGYGPEYYFRSNTITRMKSAGEYATIQRLEVTGIWTDDDADVSVSDRFDAYLHPSHLAEVDKIEEENLHWLPRSLRNIFYIRERTKAKRDDLAEAHAEMNGRLTKRGRASLTPLKDLHVNEIVAHSWGTDVVYNGILEGVIHPPRRIILIGVPSPYVTKWTELAKRLPVEVRIYSSPEDAVRRLNTIWGMRNITGPDDPAVYSQEVWKKKVDAYCARGGNRCKSPGKEGSIFIKADMKAVNRAPLLHHDRKAYYNYIVGQGELSGTPAQMSQDRDDAVTARMNGLFDNAMAKARRIVRDSPYETVTRRVCRDYTDDDLQHNAPAPTAPVMPPPAPVAPPPAPSPVQPAYKPYDELFALATAACLNPQGLTDNGIRRYLNGFPDGRSYPLSDSNIPPGCVKDLFLELMQFNASSSQNTTINREWLVKEAGRLNEKHAPQSGYVDDDGRRRSGPVYSGPCGNGGSLCGSNRPHFR